MLYELTSEPPPIGSLLGSVFTYLAQKKQEAEYFKTKSLIMASVSDKVEGGGKLLQEAMESYRNLLFPFLKKEREKASDGEKKLLKSWTSKVLKVHPLWRPSDNKGTVSRLRRGAEQVRRAEEKRRSSNHWRM
jgi:hypothetical protein